MEKIMKQREDNTLLIVLVSIVLLIVGVSAGFTISSQDRGNNEKQNQPNIIVINNTSVPVYNNTAVLNQISELKTILNEDDIWKAKAITLAEDEWKTSRELYNALIRLNVTDIDEKGDINNVIIKHIDTSSVDVDEKNADISEEVRVYYENSAGDDKRVTLIIDTEIVDNEVEDVTYALA